MGVPTLDGARVRLRAVTEGDLERLQQIMKETEVAQWGIDLDEHDLLGSVPDGVDTLITFAIESHVDGGGVVGWIGAYEKADPEYRHAGIDVFLSATSQGIALGPEAIRLVCRYLFDERGHHRIVIDPAAANTRAIRAYEKVGFRRVGVMRQYERGPDGTWHDGVLLDLLPNDLPVAH